jgi:hypothetical protein
MAVTRAHYEIEIEPRRPVVERFDHLSAGRCSPATGPAAA